jgi:preprotein translocase subunit SecE
MADKGKSANIVVVAGNKVIGYFVELKHELKRMTWPTQKDVKKAVIAVGVFCIIYIVMIAAFDYCFKNLYNFIFKV